MPTQPLADVSVVELSTMIAGPYAGQMLGDLGADVVKIERPGRGELARGLEPTLDGESFYYLTANRNKRSLALDVTSDEGHEIFMDLVESVDVVLENFPPSFTERYDIDYESVRERNEDVIYCSISAYGETGPYRTDPGIDTTIQALSGAMSTTRDENTPPMRSGVPMNDVFASLYATQGILTALYSRERTGEGEFIDVSMLDAGVAGLTTRATYSMVSGEPYPPFGRRHNYFAPEGVYEVGDGEVQLSVVTDRHWEWFCEAIDAPSLLADERFETTNSRVRHSDALEEALTRELREWSAAELVETLREAGVPAAPINDTLSVWDHPQVQAREMRRTLDHPTAGAVDVLGFPVKYGSIDQRIDRHPPLLGEHTEAILSELGYDTDEIARLSNDGAVDTGT
ncbi:CaiB/BaiF CoA transferase family protein [Haloferax sp. YSMS24]|uniref:CaiB/BaiF CoA transferase family protein n=1 Tax=Haloferax sp. YSMS24 TaxID=3388425 RepID=UPI00398C9B5B